MAASECMARLEKHKRRGERRKVLLTGSLAAFLSMKNNGFSPHLSSDTSVSLGMSTSPDTFGVMRPFTSFVFVSPFEREKHK